MTVEEILTLSNGASLHLVRDRVNAAETTLSITLSIKGIKAYMDITVDQYEDPVAEDEDSVWLCHGSARHDGEQMVLIAGNEEDPNGHGSLGFPCSEDEKNIIFAFIKNSLPKDDEEESDDEDDTDTVVSSESSETLALESWQFKGEAYWKTENNEVFENNAGEPGALIGFFNPLTNKIKRVA